MIKSRKNVVPHNSKRNYILRGLVECGCCSNKMSGQSQINKEGNKYYYYRCKKCGVSINAQNLEDYILNIIKEYLSKNMESLKAAILKELKNTQYNKNEDKKLIENRIKEINNEQDRLIDFICKGTASDRVSIKLKSLDDELEALKSEVSKLDKGLTITEDELVAWLDKLKNDLDNYEDINKIINSLIEKIIVSDDELKINVRITKEDIIIRNSNDITKRSDEPLAP